MKRKPQKCRFEQNFVVTQFGHQHDYPLKCPLTSNRFVRESLSSIERDLEIEPNTTLGMEDSTIGISVVTRYHLNERWIERVKSLGK